MIAKLKGIVDSFFVDSVLVDVNGVCYSVLISSKLSSTLAVGNRIELMIYHIFKPEQQFLCGFQDIRELTIFKSLLDVPGIGVKSAMSILSNLSAEELAIAIANQDSGALVNISGIGKKSAARILLELKDKTSLKIKDIVSATKGTQSTNVDDAILGLISLGFSRNQVMSTISKVANEGSSDMSTNELIVLCLRELQ